MRGDMLGWEAEQGTLPSRVGGNTHGIGSGRGGGVGGGACRLGGLVIGEVSKLVDMGCLLDSLRGVCVLVLTSCLNRMAGNLGPMDGMRLGWYDVMPLLTVGTRPLMTQLDVSLVVGCGYKMFGHNLCNSSLWNRGCLNHAFTTAYGLLEAT
jgi:hypothetical protein